MNQRIQFTMEGKDKNENLLWWIVFIVSLNCLLWICRHLWREPSENRELISNYSSFSMKACMLFFINFHSLIVAIRTMFQCLKIADISCPMNLSSFSSQYKSMLSSLVNIMKLFKLSFIIFLVSEDWEYKDGKYLSKNWDFLDLFFSFIVLDWLFVTWCANANIQAVRTKRFVTKP